MRVSVYKSLLRGSLGCHTQRGKTFLISHAWRFQILYSRSSLDCKIFNSTQVLWWKKLDFHIFSLAKTTREVRIVSLRSGPHSFLASLKSKLWLKEDLFIIWFKRQTWRRVWGDFLEVRVSELRWYEFIAKSSCTSCDRWRGYFLPRFRSQGVTASMWHQGFAGETRKTEMNYKLKAGALDVAKKNASSPCYVPIPKHLFRSSRFPLATSDYVVSLG